MGSKDSISVGIDTTSGHKAFTVAALDHELGLLRLAAADFDEVIEFLQSQPGAIVALNSPSHVNAGVIRRQLERDGKSPSSLRGADIREAEFDLHGRGISVSGTPRLEAQCPAWVQLGFALLRKLLELGYVEYPSHGRPRQWLETHPHAAFSTLLGRSPLAKPSLEGRLQRALLLFERGVKIRDPMSFLEEITRHRLLTGSLPTEIVPLPGELDSLVAAYTAWMAGSRPGEVTRIGNKQEGHMVLPVGALKATY